MYKKRCMAAAGNYPIDCEREANLLPLSFLATSFFPPRIQTGMMWWRIWPRAPFPDQIWKPFLPPCRTNSACIHSTGRAFPKGPRTTQWECTGFILDFVYRLDGLTEEKQSACRKRVYYKECRFYTVGYMMFVWWAADHIFIHFQTVLSQKHIITCHNIHSPALVKNRPYRFFFLNLAER